MRAACKPFQIKRHHKQLPVKADSHLLPIGGDFKALQIFGGLKTGDDLFFGGRPVHHFGTFPDNVGDSLPVWRPVQIGFFAGVEGQLFEACAVQVDQPDIFLMEERQLVRPANHQGSGLGGGLQRRRHRRR